MPKPNRYSLAARARWRGVSKRARQAYARKIALIRAAKLAKLKQQIRGASRVA